jgi:hypothetical protein
VPDRQPAPHAGDRPQGLGHPGRSTPAGGDKTQVPPEQFGPDTMGYGSVRPQDAREELAGGILPGLV